MNGISDDLNSFQVGVNNIVSAINSKTGSTLTEDSTNEEIVNVINNIEVGFTVRFKNLGNLNYQISGTIKHNTSYLGYFLITDNLVYGAGFSGCTYNVLYSNSTTWQSVVYINPTVSNGGTIKYSYQGGGTHSVKIVALLV